MDHTHVGIMAIDLDQLFETQRTAAGFYTLKCFLAPERLKLPIGRSEAAGQGRAENDGEFGPVVFLRRIFDRERARFYKGGFYGELCLRVRRAALGCGQC